MRGLQPLRTRLPCGGLHHDEGGGHRATGGLLERSHAATAERGWQYLESLVSVEHLKVGDDPQKKAARVDFGISDRSTCSSRPGQRFVAFRTAVAVELPGRSHLPD